MPSFIIVGCVWQILGRGREQPQKSPSWIGLKVTCFNTSILSTHWCIFTTPGYASYLTLTNLTECSISTPPENQRFSDIFRRYRDWTLNGLEWVTVEVRCICSENVGKYPENVRSGTQFWVFNFFSDWVIETLQKLNPSSLFLLILKRIFEKVRKLMFVNIVER